MKKRGQLIVIEGTDGSGKATQAKLLVRALRRKGKRIHAIAFPQYGKKSAAPVEAFLNGEFGPPWKLGPYRSATLFAVDRVAARQQLLEWRRHGETIVADRYVASGLAYDGAAISSPVARRKFWQWSQDFQYRVLGLPKPDMTIVLLVPPRIAQRLILVKHVRRYLRGRKRDHYERERWFQERVIQRYRELATVDRSMKIIECVEGAKLLSKKEIHHRIMRVLGLKTKLRT